MAAVGGVYEGVDGALHDLEAFDFGGYRVVVRCFVAELTEFVVAPALDFAARQGRACRFAACAYLRHAAQANHFSRKRRVNGCAVAQLPRSVLPPAIDGAGGEAGTHVVEAYAQSGGICEPYHFGRA